MTISSYQVQNIIKLYNRQLKVRHTGKADVQQGQKSMPEDVVDISNEGKKKNVLDRAGTEAVKKLKDLALEPYKV